MSSTEFQKLLEASSLGHNSTHTHCEAHGEQLRDPFTDRCMKCDTEKHEKFQNWLETGDK